MPTAKPSSSHSRRQRNVRPSPSESKQHSTRPLDIEPNFIRHRPSSSATSSSPAELSQEEKDRLFALQIQQQEDRHSVRFWHNPPFLVFEDNRNPAAGSNGHDFNAYPRSHVHRSRHPFEDSDSAEQQLLAALFGRGGEDARPIRMFISPNGQRLFGRSSRPRSGNADGWEIDDFSYEVR